MTRQHAFTPHYLQPPERTGVQLSPTGRQKILSQAWFSATFGATPDSEEANPLYTFRRLNKQALHHLRSHVESSENRVCSGPYLQYRAGVGRGITPQGFSSGKGLVS